MPDRVLIVDDEKHIRDVLCESLSSSGFEVTAVATGEDALTAIDAAAPDLMVVDLKMPGISGLDLIREARPRIPDVQAIILTGFGDMPSAVEALRLDAYDYLTKPVDLERLHRTLLNAAERRRLLLENRDLVRRLQHANRLKAEFISGMSHEVRTPLGHVTGFTQILQETLEGLTDKQQGYLANIHTAATGLLAMFENILQFSELKTHDVDLRLENVDVEGLLAEALEAVRPAAIEEGLSLASDSSVEQNVLLDRRNVTKVLSLLLDNAIKFTDEGGIDVRAERKEGNEVPEGLAEPPAASVDGWLHITVRDTGIGIAEDDRERIFNLFEQADGSLTRSHEGTGIGLALALGLARLHGGTIRVEGGRDRGSAFTLIVPVADSTD